MRRQDPRECLVEPVDDRYGGAEVDAQRQPLQPHGTESTVADVEEQADLRVAEPIDRLHRIADQEQRTAVASLPAGGQCLDQSELRIGGVLELVDQHVPQARVERERGIGGRVRVAEGGARRGREPRIVRDASLGEHDLQFRDGEAQHREQSPQHLPFGVVVTRLGQPAHASRAVLRARHAARARRSPHVPAV